MQICVLNHTLVQQFKQTGVRPPCEHHRHVSRNKAIRLLRNEEAIHIEDLQAIVMYVSVERYTWKGAFSDCARVMQMLPIRG